MTSAWRWCCFHIGMTMTQVRHINWLSCRSRSLICKFYSIILAWLWFLISSTLIPRIEWLQKKVLEERDPGKWRQSCVAVEGPGWETRQTSKDEVIVGVFRCHVTMNMHTKFQEGVTGMWNRNVCWILKRFLMSKSLKSFIEDKLSTRHQVINAMWLDVDCIEDPRE